MVQSLYETSTGVLPIQVIQAYCNVALKKLKLPPQHIRAQLELYEQFEVVQVTPAIIRPKAVTPVRHQAKQTS